MCGRFTITASPEDLQAAFPWLDAIESFPASYNIAPSQPIPVVPNDGSNRMTFFSWGLVPYWAQDPKIGYKMINARSETIHEKPAYKNAYWRRRCIVLASGFYEWAKTSGSKIKQPYYFTLKDGKPFGFAGIWEHWNGPDGSIIRSASIITTEPNDLVRKVHGRMPAILKPEHHLDWLSPEEKTRDELSFMLNPFPADQMDCYPVSTIVNSPRNNSPECIQPLRSLL